MTITPAQNAAIVELKRLRLWLEAGPDDDTREAAWRQVVANRRASVDAAVAKALRIICTSREDAAAITRILETIGDAVPDTDRRAELNAAAVAKRHLMPEALVTAIMTALQDDVDDAPAGSYSELAVTPRKPGVGDPTTVAAVDAAITSILEG